MTRRVLKRMKLVLPARITIERDGRPQQCLAHTLDVHSTGARMGGVHSAIAVGEIVTIQYQHRRGVFRVTWVGTRGTRTGTQIGGEPGPAKGYLGHRSAAAHSSGTAPISQ